MRTNDEGTRGMDDELMLAEREAHGASWVSGTYHQLDAITGECLTCGDRRREESGLDHLLRTAEWHGYEAGSVVI